MTGPLYLLGRLCARHHWIVIGLWIVAAVALALGARAAGDRTSDDLTLPGTDSTLASDLLTERLPQQANGTNPVVLQARTGTLADDANAKAVAATASSLGRAPHVIRVVSPLSQGGASALSADKRIGYISVTLDQGPADLTEDEAQDIVDAADPARDAGLTVAVGGYVGKEVSKSSTESSELIGLVAAMVILLFAFGTATAMALPIVTALLGLVAGLAVIRFIGFATEVPSIAPTLATMIGLGVGIDYALFIVTKHRLQLRDGMEVRESIARATATAGGAVAFAGVTVVIALCSLAAAGIPLVTALGFTAAAAVCVAVLAAVTLLPALLGALGPRINSLRVKLGRTHPDDHRPHGWARWASGVARRPWIALVGGVAVLLVLAAPVLGLSLGQNDVGALSRSTTARQAYDLLSEGFGPGSNGPMLVAVQLGSPAKAPPTPPGAAPTSDPRLTKLQGAIGKTPGVTAVSPVSLDSAGTAGVFSVVASTAPSSDETEDLVDRLRDSVIPSADRGSDVQAYVGGQTAAYIDLAGRVGDKLPWMILIVVSLSFLVLLLGFRSILVPAKAAIANLISVAAAYGVVTAVFERGWGAELIGLDGSVPVVSFVPLLMFAILFGLSMDYEVFLMSQMQEHYQESGDPRRAVVDGVATTGRVITSAALIMVFVFASFVLNGDPTVKQFGVGLAVAIAIDATIVRCLVVPAVMVLMRGRAWWIPAWLDRGMPRISIEGQDYFAARDAAASGPALGEPRPSGRA